MHPMLFKSACINFEHFIKMATYPYRKKERIPYLPKRLHDTIMSTDSIVAEKLDGALTHVYIRNDAPSKAFSHRISKRTGLPIEHTGKIPDLKNTLSPKGDVDLKGEFLFFDKNDKVVPHQEISGLLNSKDETAKNEISRRGYSPRIALFDIFDDKRPYLERFNDVQEIAKANPKVFTTPRIATTPREKERLISDIKSGNNPRTNEGIILDGASKVKFRNYADVYINSFFPTKKEGGKYEGNAVGGFVYSLTPKGPPIGNVGTGFTDELRKDMHNNPSAYIGKKVNIEHQGQYEATKQYRSPSFKSLY